MSGTMRHFVEIDSLMNYLNRELAQPWAKSVPVTRANGKEDLQILRVLNNIQFSITPNLNDLTRRVIDDFGHDAMRFLKKEAHEWLTYEDFRNPGQAINEQSERWAPLLNSQGRMDYTYNERLQWQRESIAKALAGQDYNRQIYMSVWDPRLDISNASMSARVPCILGYYFNKGDDGIVTTTAIMRSCDLNNCLVNDVYLAKRLQDTMVRTADSVRVFGTQNITAGPLVFSIMDLHAYPLKNWLKE